MMIVKINHMQQWAEDKFKNRDADLVVIKADSVMEAVEKVLALYVFEGENTLFEWVNSVTIEGSLSLSEMVRVYANLYYLIEDDRVVKVTEGDLIELFDEAELEDAGYYAHKGLF